MRERMEGYFGGLSRGNHIVFSHGGPITVSLQDFGVESMPTNGSIAGVIFDDDQVADGKIKNLEFLWEFPVVEEDI